MQDRFKCRVWDKDAKEYLTLYKEDEKTGMHSYWIGWDNSGVYQYDRDVERDIVFVTDISQFVELEQCTSLKDKNGKLIYEGDIVILLYEETQNIKYTCVVKWCEYSASYRLVDIEHEDEDYDFTPCEEKEIIGNIHENADLLEKEDE